MSAYSHLSETASAKADAPDNERIEHIKKDRWIPYGRAKEILDKLDELLTHPTRLRMPNMLIVGESNNGKSMLVDKFRKRHPATENLSGDAVVVPVLYIQAPPTPDERSFYSEVLKVLFEPYARSESMDARRNRVLSVLKRVSLGMIIVDELHTLLQGSYVKQRAFLNVLKYLGNELRVPIVGVGTAEVVRAVQTDPQLANRFLPEVLPKWTRGSELSRLLVSFERILPLRKPSELANPALASRIVDKAEGTIGEISSVLDKAAIKAIRSGEERITLDILDACGYISPAQRKQVAAFA